MVPAHRGRAGPSTNGLTTGRAVAVLAVVVGCLGVLWPKIFYPMMMVALRGSDAEVQDFPPPMSPRGPMAARLQQTGKRVPSPQARMAAPGPQGTKALSKGSSFNIIMPIYTLGIIIVFVYMIFKIMSRGDRDKVDLDRLAYNEGSQLAQRAMAARRSGQDVAKGQNNNFEPPRRNRRDPRNAFENNTKNVLKMYGKDKMLDALNVVVNEMHEYKKQAFELAKQLEEQKRKKQADADVPSDEDDVAIDERQAAVQTRDSLVPTDDEDSCEDEEEAAQDEMDQDSLEVSDQQRSGSPEEDLEDDADLDGGVPSDAPSEQDSDESEKDIDTQPDDSAGTNDEGGLQDDEVPDLHEDEVGQFNGSAGEDVDEEWEQRHVEESDEVGEAGGDCSNDGNEVVDADQDLDDRDEAEVQDEVDNEERQDCGRGNDPYDEDQDEQEDFAGMLGRHRTTEDAGTETDLLECEGPDQEKEDDAEVEELLREEEKSSEERPQKVDKSVYARHPHCLCSTPPPETEPEVCPDEAQDPDDSRHPASTIDDICRNREGLQFLDHATEIEPGTRLQCYDDVIYGQCVTERGPHERNGNFRPDAAPTDGLQVLQDFIVQDRRGQGGRQHDFGRRDQRRDRGAHNRGYARPSNYQQWTSITPEDLFKTATDVVEKTNERNANRGHRPNQQRPPYRNHNDRTNGNFQNERSRQRPPQPPACFYEDSVPAGAPRSAEDNPKVRRRNRRPRRAD